MDAQIKVKFPSPDEPVLTRQTRVFVVLDGASIELPGLLSLAHHPAAAGEKHGRVVLELSDEALSVDKPETAPATLHLRRWT